MNQELTTTTPSEIIPQSVARAASTDLAAWAQAMADSWQIAKTMTMTNFVQPCFQGERNQGSAVVAIMKGAALGLDPTAALESIYVISGKPAMYARAMVAVVMRAGHEIWTEDASDTSVTVCGKRRGSEHVERSTWTIERAQRAGYTSNKKYMTNPQEMLYAKASTEVARHIAPDALMGLSYAVEEIELDATEPVKIQRKRKPSEPEVDEPLPQAVESDAA